MQTCTANESFWDFVWRASKQGDFFELARDNEEAFWCLPIRPSGEFESCD